MFEKRRLLLLLFQWDPSDEVPQQATADPHERDPESDSDEEMPPPDQEEGREDPQLPHQQQPAVLGKRLTEAQHRTLLLAFTNVRGEVSQYIYG